MRTHHRGQSLFPAQPLGQIGWAWIRRRYLEIELFPPSFGGGSKNPSNALGFARIRGAELRLNVP